MRGLTDTNAFLAAATRPSRRAVPRGTANGWSALATTGIAPGGMASVRGDPGDPAAAVPPPPYVVTTLRAAGKLIGVPLAYLVPDPGLLPAESLQFFVVDPAWVRALQRGLLGSASPMPMTDEELDDLIEGAIPPGPVLTGMLLHSSLVSQYPTLAARAWTGALGVQDDPDDPANGALPVAVLRQERLTPSTLLTMFDRVPDLVVIDEPHGMVRVGVTRGPQGQPVVRLRAADATLIERSGFPVVVEVPFRDDPAAGVIDVSALALTLRSGLGSTPAPGRAPDPSASSAALCVQLLGEPTRQRYQRGV